MSLTRTNSRTNLHENNLIIDANINPKPDEGMTEDSLNITSSNSAASTSELHDVNAQPSKKKPEMKLQIPVEQNSSKIKEMNLSPRQIPKSPRLLKSKNSTLSEKTSPRNELKISLEEKHKPSVDEKEENEKNSFPSNQVVDFQPEPPSSSEPIFQVRRTKILAPTRLLHQKTEETTTATSSTPRNTNIFSSDRSSSSTSTSTINTEKSTPSKASPPSIEDCSRAILYLIFKKYEINTLTSGSIGAFGREDIYFAVKAIPQVLTHLTEFPDNGITSISELLIALFGDELRNSPAWKNVDSEIEKAKLLDDGSVVFGETDPEIKQKYFSLLKPHAQNIADNILGNHKKILGSALPTALLNLLFEGDKKLLEVCMTSSKLRAREMNDARLHFLFDMVVTRFAQVMAMDGFPERPSQVESWFASAIIEALGEGIKSLSNDFLGQSNTRMPTDLKKKFLEKVEAETREDEAIKKFKLIELKKNRINELQKRERHRGHSRANSHAMLANVKLERDYKKKLDEIKTQCGFDDMGTDFLKFINENQNISFDPALKITVSNVILNLKLAVREYEEMKRNGGFKTEQKIKDVIEKLDNLFESEFNAKKKRRTTAFSKDINFTEKLRQNSESNRRENSSESTLSTAPITTSSDTPSSAHTSSSVTASTTVRSTQLRESSSEEKYDE